MARLPSDHTAHRRLKRRTPTNAPDGIPSDWRTAPSVMGRGDYRCGICQRVFERGDDTEVFEDERCHSECVEMDG